MAGYLKPMLYVKRTACGDLALADFSAQWKALSEKDKTDFDTWANAEQAAVGILPEE